MEQPFFINKARLKTSKSYFSLGSHSGKGVLKSKEGKKSWVYQKLLETASGDTPGETETRPILSLVEPLCLTSICESIVEEEFYKSSRSFSGTMRILLSRFPFILGKHTDTRRVDDAVQETLESIAHDELELGFMATPDGVTEPAAPMTGTIKQKFTVENETIEKIPARRYQLDLENGESTEVEEITTSCVPGGLQEIVEKDGDFKSAILSKYCSTLVWVWSKKSRIALITESNNPRSWSVQQWYRRILSDMALADSMIIKHPYFWHSAFRKKMNRAINSLKRMYKIIDYRKRQGKPSRHLKEKKGRYLMFHSSQDLLNVEKSEGEEEHLTQGYEVSKDCKGPKKQKDISSKQDKLDAVTIVEGNSEEVSSHDATSTFYRQTITETQGNQV